MRSTSRAVGHCSRSTRRVERPIKHDDPWAFPATRRARSNGSSRRARSSQWSATASTTPQGRDALAPDRDFRVRASHRNGQSGAGGYCHGVCVDDQVHVSQGRTSNGGLVCRRSPISIRILARQSCLSATTWAFTRTSGATFNIRIRGGSIPKSRMSNVASPSSSMERSSGVTNAISSS